MRREPDKRRFKVEYSERHPLTIKEILARQEGERKPAAKFIFTEGGIMELGGKYGTKEELKNVTIRFWEDGEQTRRKTT